MTLPKAPQLRVQIASDVAHEELVAEMYCDEKFVGLLTHESGNDKLLFVLPDRTTPIDLVADRVPLDWFRTALEEAEEKLIQRNSLKQ